MQGELPQYHDCLYPGHISHAVKYVTYTGPGFLHGLFSTTVKPLIKRTESPILDVFRFVLQLSLPNPLTPIVKSRKKIQLEQRRQAMLQQHLNDQQFY